jgi:phosphoglucosamine mutase
MDVLVRSGKPLTALVSDLKVFPQVIKNVRVREKTPLAQVPAIQQEILKAERSLNGNGRVVVRYSGTEALARVMVEAESEDKMKAIAESIAGAIQTALGV